MKKLNVVIIGTTNRRASQYIDILGRKCNVINVLESIPVQTEGLYEKIRFKLGVHLDKNGINEKIVEIVKNNKVDLILDFKSLVLKNSTIDNIKELNPRIKLAFFSEDDMLQNHNNSKCFLKAISKYDVIFTTKSYNVDELVSLGAKKVVFQNKSFDENYHRPIKLTRKDYLNFSSSVSFVGTFEKDRASIMVELAKRGIPVTIWGNGWESLLGLHENLIIKNTPVYGDDFIKVICSSRINLNFLRKSNRDLQTDRSVEIPACQAFMLTERTPEHSAMFVEGKEAEFFDVKNIDELEEKIKFYLVEEEKRRMIALNGYNRCLISGYSHSNKIEEWVNVVNEIT